MNPLKGIKRSFPGWVIPMILVSESAQADVFKDLGNLGQKVGGAVTTAAQKIAPPPVGDLYNKVHNAINPDKIGKDLLARIDFKAKQISSSIVDQALIDQINAVIVNFKTVSNAAQDILKGPCGPHAFVERVPPWFQQQLRNMGAFIELAKDSGKITAKIMGSAPHVLTLAAALEKIGEKVAKDATTPQNLKVLAEVADNFRKSIEAVEQIPTAIESGISFVLNIGEFVTEGSACASSLGSSIKEGVEAIAEGVGGVAACAASAGAGCAEELLTLKSAAIGAASDLISKGTCVLTMVRIAKDGAKDLQSLVKFMKSLNSIVAEVVAIKNAIVMAVQTLEKIDKTIRADIPTLKGQLNKIEVDFKEVSKMIEGIIPKVELFGNDLMGQFKHNLDDLAMCKAKVDHLAVLSGKNFVEAINHTKEAGQHILKMEKMRKLVQEDIEVARKNALSQMHGRLASIQKKVEDIKRNPVNALRDIPLIIAEAAQLPIDLANSAIKTLDENTKPRVNEAQQSKLAVQSKLEKVQQLLRPTQTAKLTLPQPLPAVKEDIPALTKAITSFRKM